MERRIRIQGIRYDNKSAEIGTRQVGTLLLKGDEIVGSVADGVWEEAEAVVKEAS